jgi:O-antigen/teichoic acid export membrane protein
MLGALAESREVGDYAVAARCIMPLMLFRLAFSMVIEPRIAHHHHQGTLNERRDDVRRATRWYARAVALFVGVAIAGREVVPLVFGEAYDTSISSLVWLAVGYGVGAWLGVGGTILNMTGAPRQELVNGAITLALNVLLCLILIPQHGAEGAAIATTVSLVAMGALRIIQVRAHVGWSPVGLRDLVPFLAAAAALAVGTRLDPASTLGIIAGVALVGSFVALELLLDLRGMMRRRGHRRAR